MIACSKRAQDCGEDIRIWRLSGPQVSIWLYVMLYTYLMLGNLNPSCFCRVPWDVLKGIHTQYHNKIRINCRIRMKWKCHSTDYARHKSCSPLFDGDPTVGLLRTRIPLEITLRYQVSVINYLSRPLFVNLLAINLQLHPCITICFLFSLLRFVKWATKEKTLLSIILFYFHRDPYVGCLYSLCNWVIESPIYPEQAFFLSLLSSVFGM